MMRKRRITGFVMAAVLAFTGLTGCGKNDAKAPGAESTEAA